MKKKNEKETKIKLKTEGKNLKLHKLILALGKTNLIYSNLSEGISQGTFLIGKWVWLTFQLDCLIRE